MANRKVYDQKTKDGIVQRVLAGLSTVKQEAKLNRLQPYQIYAWIGERTTEKAAGGTPVAAPYPSSPAVVPTQAPIEDTTTLRALQMSDNDSSIDPVLSRAVGEFVLRRIGAGLNNGGK